MELTLMVLLFSSYVPTTLTFWAANFAGIFWSVSFKTFWPSNNAYWPDPFTQSLTHAASDCAFIIAWVAPQSVSVMTPVKVRGASTALSAPAIASVKEKSFIVIILLIFQPAEAGIVQKYCHRWDGCHSRA